MLAYSLPLAACLLVWGGRHRPDFLRRRLRDGGDGSAPARAQHRVLLPRRRVLALAGRARRAARERRHPVGDGGHPRGAGDRPHHLLVRGRRRHRGRRDRGPELVAARTRDGSRRSAGARARPGVAVPASGCRHGGDRMDSCGIACPPPSRSSQRRSCTSRQPSRPARDGTPRTAACCSQRGRAAGRLSPRAPRRRTSARPEPLWGGRGHRKRAPAYPTRRSPGRAARPSADGAKRPARARPRARRCSSSAGCVTTSKSSSSRGPAPRAASARWAGPTEPKYSVRASPARRRGAR